MIPYFLSLAGGPTSCLIFSPSDLRTMKRIPGWILSQAPIKFEAPWYMMKVARQDQMALDIVRGITFALVLFL